MSGGCHDVSTEPPHQPLSGESLPLITANQGNPYYQHETSKHCQYEERVREVEHGNFSPLVFSTAGGMGASTAVAYKHLAFLLSCKWKSPYCR